LDSMTVAADGRFCVPSPKVAWQSFEDELVVINLESGTYYSLDRAGAILWRLIEAGATPTEAVAHLRQSGAPPEAPDQVFEFWGKLLEEGLISPAPNGEKPRAIPEEPVCPWTPPSISTYTDMQDLFLLDPVHEVDEAGWPSRPAEER
jgi:hypothetical protein